MKKLPVPNKWISLIVLCTLLPVLFPVAGSAHTPASDLQMVPEYRHEVELPLLSDTWLAAGHTSTNCECYAALICRTTGLDNILLTFDRSDLPMGARIGSAKLTIDVMGETGASGKELTVLNVEKFDSRSAIYEDNIHIFHPSVSKTVVVGPMVFDVKNQVRVWNLLEEPLRSGDRVGQLAISATGPAGRVFLDSLETWHGNPPQLVITYIP